MADMEPVEMPTGTKKVSLKRLADDEGSAMTIKSKNDNSFLYAESKRARMEREKEEKKRRAQEIEFSAQDLALATVPGMEFDPRQRAFAPDELRPQPIIRKRKKVRTTLFSILIFATINPNMRARNPNPNLVVYYYFSPLQTFVDMDHKDDRYWEKREKNNVAARRSREARRLKENQIALRTAYLEKENNMLKSQAEEVRAENMELIAEKQILLEKLKKYEGRS